MKLQIVAAILLITILSPKRSSAEQLFALDHETPFEEAVGVEPHPHHKGYVFTKPPPVGFPRVFPHPAGGGFALVFRKRPPGKGFALEFMNQAPRFVGG
ncbi:unnamed protein product [Natator depressus]